MFYQKENNKIIIHNLADFNIQHILECGQVFSYKKVGNIFYVFPQDKLCKVYYSNNCCIIESENIDYFENYFDLKTDYSKMKKELLNFPELKLPIEFGSGIRILKQDLLETIISFIISANNNIKRITSTLLKLREHFNKEIKNSYNEKFFEFPKLSELESLNESFFVSIGAGYRAKYLVETIKLLKQFLTDFSFEKSEKIETKVLLAELLKLKGVGRKVAECILLFGYGKKDVFPVDTWIKKVYSDLFKFTNLKSADSISDFLINRYKNLSGYAQQYLFYSKRENS